MDPLILRLSAFRFPIVAAVNGAAVGAGMSLALASDIIVAGESAYFCPSFARLGLVPDAGITFHLARCIGASRSLSSLMLAEKIDSKTAREWGLAYAVVPDAEVVSRAQGVARKLAHRTYARCSARFARCMPRPSIIRWSSSCARSAAPRRCRSRPMIASRACAPSSRSANRIFPNADPSRSQPRSAQARSARMSSGVVRQQPPISRAPAAYQSRTARSDRRGVPSTQRLSPPS